MGEKTDGELCLPLWQGQESQLEGAKALSSCLKVCVRPGPFTEMAVFGATCTGPRRWEKGLVKMNARQGILGPGWDRLAAVRRRAALAPDQATLIARWRTRMLRAVARGRGVISMEKR
jgi:hypothetical protein